jgi:hypothetical protein
MDVFGSIRVREEVIGAVESRYPVVVLIGIELLVITFGFLLQFDTLVPGRPLFWITVILVIAPGVYAGWQAGGIATGIAGVWTVLLWVSTFPPLVGYIYRSDAYRYDHIGLTANPFGSQRRELLYAIEYGVTIWLAIAVLLGIGCYLLGWGLREGAAYIVE